MLDEWNKPEDADAYISLSGGEPPTLQLGIDKACPFQGIVHVLSVGKLSIIASRPF